MDKEPSMIRSLPMRRALTILVLAGGLGAFWYAEVRKKKQSATVANAAAAN